MITNREIKACEWPAGKVIGEGYVLADKLGDDGVTSLYRAQTAAGEPRLVSALSAELADDPALVREFRDIGYRVCRAHHPNLPPVEASGDAEGRPFLVTVPASGRTLEELLRAEGRVPPLRACAIARQVAAALEAVHRLNLLHLGLEPRQILLSGDTDHVELQGLGAGQVRLSRAGRGKSSTGRPLSLRDLMPAAPAYCAPEAALAKSPETLDERADLYSLGVLTYQMLSGRLPAGVTAPDDDGLDMLVWQLEPFAAPLEFGAGIPEPLARLVQQLLEKRPELRPSTAKVVREAIDLAAAGLGTPVTQPSRTPAAPTKGRGVTPLSPLGLQPLQPPSQAIPQEPDRATLSPGPSEPPAAAPFARPAREPIRPSLAESDRLTEWAPELAPELASQSMPESASPLAPVPPLERLVSEPAEDFAGMLLEVSAPEPAAAPLSRPGAWQIRETPPAAGPVAVPAGPVPLGDSTSLLLKTSPASEPPAGWGRRALAGIVVVLVIAVAIFFIGESKKLQWDSPTPTAVDEQHSLSRPEANPSTAPSSTIEPAAASPSQAGGAAAQAQAQPKGQAPPGAGPESSPAVVAPGRAPAGGANPGVKPALGSTSDAVEDEVRRAVSAGDVFYQMGQYDLAIQAYQGPLKDTPQNETLRGRIERARKAKAAEQEYLGQ
jgi:serine/threonine protein kinase